MTRNRRGAASRVLAARAGTSRDTRAGVPDGAWLMGRALQRRSRATPLADGASRTPGAAKRKKILAVASSGGHWIQLLRLQPAFEGHEVLFVTTAEGNRSDVDGHEFRLVTNADRRMKLKFAVMCVEWVRILLTEKPDVIVTTGAAPGMVALMVGKALRRRTVWIDSIANAERLSTSGVIVRRFADLYLTQWEHLAGRDGPHFAGSVL